MRYNRGVNPMILGFNFKKEKVRLMIKKIMLLFLVVLVSVAAVKAADAKPNDDAANAANRRKLPYKALNPDNQKTPHILFVNVNNAVSAEQLDKALGLINSMYGFNIWHTSIKKSVVSEVVADSGFVASKFGQNAILVVFIERRDKGYNYLQAPGWWAMVNVGNLDKDSPVPAVLQERIAKVCLRGLAMSCGVNANHDPRCVMYVNGFDLKGMDSVSYSFSPFAYQPLHQVLKKFGEMAPFRKH
jgi:hypothetical protein